MLILLAAVAPGQWQVDNQVGPVYPTKSYSFRTTSPNYDPFQFNWATGRWDYVPIPYDERGPASNGGPYYFNAYSGRWEYSPMAVPAPAANASATPPPPAPGGEQIRPQSDNQPVPSPESANQDDSGLWVGPSTEPAGPPPKSVTFQGRIVGLRAVNLGGDHQPHILLRLRSATGATGTIDVGERLHIPEAESKSGAGAVVVATGKLGSIDGHLVLFADKLRFGSQEVSVERGEQIKPASQH